MLLKYAPNSKAAEKGADSQYTRDLLSKFRAKDEAEQKTGEVILQPVSSLKLKPVVWLWKPLFALGKVSILVGDPGVGKSHATLYVAASVTRGRTFVDGATCPAGNVVVMSAEDGAEDTILPRLMAAGADLDKVFLVPTVTTGFDKNGEPVGRGFNVNDDVPQLAAAIEKLGNVKLIIIDPITAYTPKTDTHNNSDVRAALRPLANLAEQSGVSIIIVTHFNKNEGQKAMKRLSGSDAYAAAARSVVVVGRDPGEEDSSPRRVMMSMKNNLGNDPLRVGVRSGRGRSSPAARH